MPKSKLRLIKRCAEYIPKEYRDQVPHNTRGIYVLYQEIQDDATNILHYNVVYVGMAGAEKSGIHGRLESHTKSSRKRDLWTHFSFFQVYDDIPETDVRELEGIIRHIYRKDTRANILNRQKGFGKLRSIREKTLGK